MIEKNAYILATNQAKVDNYLQRKSIDLGYKSLNDRPELLDYSAISRAQSRINSSNRIGSIIGNVATIMNVWNTVRGWGS